MHDRPIDKVLEQLEDYTQRGDEYRAPCPAHGGTSPDSLSVREADVASGVIRGHYNPGRGLPLPTNFGGSGQ
jgi:hypothetical protein